MRRFLAILLTLLPAAAAARVAARPAGPAAAPEILVFAAASLRDALEALRPVCGEEAGARLVLNIGASSDLARQIEAAGRADLFFSADVEWMDRLERAGRVEPGTRRAPLSNRLVVVVPATSPLVVRRAEDLALPAVRRLSLAQPEVVPAGRYARGWLERAGLWEGLRGRLAPSLDVRSALAAVESGAADAGVVYRTDAALSSKVRVAFEVPAGDAPPIAYALAVLRGRPRPETARAVAACLAGPLARPIYERLGFIVTAEAP